jgi:hypothetical protein
LGSYFCLYGKEVKGGKEMSSSDEDWIKVANLRSRPITCTVCLDPLYPRFKELVQKIIKLRASHVKTTQVYDRMVELDPKFKTRITPESLARHMRKGHDPDWRS